MNKFLIEARIDDKIEECHLHDSARLEEILKENRKLLLFPKEGNRKTRYDVIAALLDEWVVIHSGYHSLLAENILKKKLIKEFAEYEIKRKEFRYGNSRIDFLLGNERECLLEIKGCTLVKNDVALFPDAPTKRGYRHVMELIHAIDKGYDVAVLFLVMRKAKYFSPHWEMDKNFSEALKKAYEKKAKIVACRIKFDGNAFYYMGEIAIRL